LSEGNKVEAPEHLSKHDGPATWTASDCPALPPAEKVSVTRGQHPSPSLADGSSGPKHMGERSGWVMRAKS